MTRGFKVGSDYDFNGCPIDDPEEGKVTWESYYHAHKDDKEKSLGEIKSGFIKTLAKELTNKYDKTMNE